MLARQQWAILTASVGGELLRLVPCPPNRGRLGHMEVHALIRTAQRVDRVIERLLPIDAVTQTAQPVELVQLPFPTPDPGGSHLHHERHFTLRLRFQTHVLAVIALLERRVIIACALTNSWWALSKDYDCEQESDSIGLPRLRGSVVWWPSKRRRG